MEMRKFVVTLHVDGSMSWNEYEEPDSKFAHNRSFTSDEWEKLLDGALRSVREEIDGTNPEYNWGETNKLIYKMGAAALANRLKNVY